MKNYILTEQAVTLADFGQIATHLNCQISINDNVKNKMIQSRQMLEKFVAEGRIIYGVNTSMGGFVNYLVPTEFAETLQNNLICSVATNVGEYFDDLSVRATMLARVISLSKGASAIGMENFEKYLEMLNKNVFPCIPKKGSLGASGDLGPLAFIALVGVGKWKAKYQGETLPGDEALKRAGIAPMSLSYKEGLALINGTSAMAGIGSLLWHNVNHLLKLYKQVSCLSFEGLNTKINAFSPKVHALKQHKGQYECAKEIYDMLSESTLIVKDHDIEQDIQKQSHNQVEALSDQIEDAYSLRCTPQILGPIYDTLEFVATILERELNSCSDNPLIVAEENEVFHNGHFHGQYMAMSMDYLSICLTTLSNLSDRRIDRFMDQSNSNGLPPFLCKADQGLRLGLMGGQFMSTSLTAENRSLCVPLSVQSLTSTGDFQDIVSMGLIAVRRAKEIYDNVRYIISFELLCACQAIDIRGNEGLSPHTKPLYQKVRKILPFLEQDICITPYLEELATLLQNQRDQHAAN